MAKKKKPEIETDLRSLQPEEVQACSQQLAGLIEERKSIKARAKASAREFKRLIEANEEEQERLSRMIITQQEEVPVKRQMSLAEIEDRARHELSIKQFEEESGQSLVRKDGDPHRLNRQSSPEASTAQKSDASAAPPATVDDLILEFENRGSIPTNEIIRRGLYELSKTAMFSKLLKETENVSGDGYVMSLTRNGKAELAKLIDARKKKRKPKAVTAAKDLIAEKSDVVDDPLDLVPFDLHHRNWNDLSDVELVEWRQRLSNKDKLAKLFRAGQVADVTLMLERVNAEITRRDAAWQKADAKGAD